MKSKPQAQLPRAAQGFTLIELMVVMIVIGLLVSLVGLNIGGGGERRELTEATRTLYLRMQVAADEAVITNREIGLSFTETNRYRFLAFDPETSEWSPLPPGGLPSGNLPQWAEVEITQGGESGRGTGLGDSEADRLPDLVFFSSGQSTPFELRVWWQDDRDAVHRIHTDGVNALAWEKPGETDGSGSF